MQRSRNRTGPAAASADDAAVEIDATQIDAWARHAAAANGFGDATIARVTQRDQAQDRNKDARSGHDPASSGDVRRR